MLSDTENPELVLKSNTYTVKRENKINENKLKNKLVASVSDNKTKLNKNDVEVQSYSNIDFEKKGSYPVKLVVSDKKGNKTTKSAKVVVVPNKEDKEKEEKMVEKAKLEKAKNAKTNEAKEKKVNYKTKGQWALYNKPYMFSIENDKYDGDIYEGGKYKFTTTGKKSAIYDIYVSKKEYTNSSDIISNEDISCSAGGMGNIECNVSLQAGDYVYVVPTDNIAGSDGMLSIEHQ